jgi:ELP3 family radical SAM enzyme/protein acetyltransferase
MDIEEFPDHIAVKLTKIDTRVHPQLAKLKLFVHALFKSNVIDDASFKKAIQDTRRIFKIAPSKQDLIIGYNSLKSDPESNYVPNTILEKLLIKKIGRGQSGVLVITVLTSPGEFSCKYDCDYCPSEPGQPKSYLSNEPAVARANQNKFDPICQMFDRIDALASMGHVPDKLEILVLGGTWSGYPDDYKEWFIVRLYYAANVYFDDRKALRVVKTMMEEQKINETAKTRIIGLTLETRPDQISVSEIQKFRYYGCTRVQLGVQHTDDEILRGINRQCYTRHTIRALHLLKNACYKVDIHIMPDLPGSTVEIDKDMMRRILYDSDLQADQLKVYPTECTDYTKILDWYKAGTYKPYGEAVVDGKKYPSKELIDLIIWFKSQVHPWMRLNRIIRDFHESSIHGGNPSVNLRNVIVKQMLDKGLRCKCMRCREIKTEVFDINDLQIKEYKYEAQHGIEYFIAAESRDSQTLYGFCRLRVGGVRDLPVLLDHALIRELHVYGLIRGDGTELAANYKKPQHSGLGKRLLRAAETIAGREGYNRIAVISGVGVRDYYRSQGYIVSDHGYMVTNMNNRRNRYWIVIVMVIIVLIGLILSLF